MKKTILLAFALMFSALTFAQQQLAVLNHNNVVTAYYGADAFVSAYNEAENGDIITLSSGVFNATNINKAVTVRGAGAWADTMGGNTMLRNNFTISIAQDSAYHLTMEGIYFYNNVYTSTVYNPHFLKCHFQWIGLNSSSAALINASFVNCIVSSWNPQGSSYYYGYSYGYASGTQFLNSVIMDCNYYGTSVSDVYVNCVVKQDPTDASSRLFHNCVLYYDYADSNTPSNNGITSFNSLYVQMNTDSTSIDELFDPVTGHVLWNMRGMENVFKTFNGSEGENFELKDSVANNYLGTDGTQIGIYGGSMPFDPHVTSPLIKRINVASRSTSDGKLPVDIEIVNE